MSVKAPCEIFCQLDGEVIKDNEFNFAIYKDAIRYYNYDDFDEYDYVAPTISQVLKWLREEKRIEVNACWDNIDAQWIGYASEMDKPDLVGYYTPIDYDSYEQAAFAGVEYVLDNLI